MTDKIVPEFVKAISDKTGHHIRKITFFGSRVKNTHKPYSDYDFLIILDHKEPDIVNEIYDKVLDFLFDYGVNISLKIYSEKDYTKKLSMGTPFIKEIERYGKVVWKTK
jgi:predicted nucleotidyltransferase